MTNLMEIIKAGDSIWTLIVVIIGLSLFLYKKITGYMKLTKEEKIEAALKIIKSELLKLMSDAEIEWIEFEKSGDLKKSQVITEIYNKFPFLSDYINQDELIDRISKMIDEEKQNMDRIINNITVEDVEKIIDKKEEK